MKNLNFLYQNYSRTIANAFIIYVENNYTSLSLANRCLESCKKINYTASLWPGFDGTGNDILIPDHIRNQSWYKWLKITDHYQSLTEIAVSLSHISLWVKCMELDQPIVILEHDAIMIKPYIEHALYNGIVHLGSKEDLQTERIGLIPFLRSINKNWSFINKAHAYAIDPAVAKKLFARVLDRGIFESADVMLRTDDVAIIQTDVYAYEEPGETLIKLRKQ